MKIHYNEDFDSYMTTEHHITDTIELDGVKLIPITELEKIKAEMQEYWEWCDEELQAPSLKGVRTILDKHIAELKGENNG